MPMYFYECPMFLVIDHRGSLTRDSSRTRWRWREVPKGPHWLDNKPYLRRMHAQKSSYFVIYQYKVLNKRVALLFWQNITQVVQDFSWVPKMPKRVNGMLIKETLNKYPKHRGIKKKASIGSNIREQIYIRGYGVCY